LRSFIDSVNYFDFKILAYLNHLTTSSALFTKLVVAIYEDSLKLGLFVAFLWWAWFDGKDSVRLREAREKIVSSFLGSVLCLGIVRLMVMELPFRARPLSNPEFGLHFPIAGESWGLWSSFPSDHAALFSLLTFCLFTISFRLGLIALVDTVFFICLPRLFVGVHYPSDVLAGALLGIAAGYCFTRQRVRGYLSTHALRWMDAHPKSFYSTAFLLSFLLAHAFFPLTNIILRMWKLAEFLCH